MVRFLRRRRGCHTINTGVSSCDRLAGTWSHAAKDKALRGREKTDRCPSNEIAITINYMRMSMQCRDGKKDKVLLSILIIKEKQYSILKIKKNNSSKLFVVEWEADKRPFSQRLFFKSQMRRANARTVTTLWRHVTDCCLLVSFSYHAVLLATFAAFSFYRKTSKIKLDIQPIVGRSLPVHINIYIVCAVNSKVQVVIFIKVCCWAVYNLTTHNDTNIFLWYRREVIVVNPTIIPDQIYI
mgnify:CR=1 FL=1